MEGIVSSRPSAKIGSAIRPTRSTGFAIGYGPDVPTTPSAWARAVSWSSGGCLAG